MRARWRTLPNPALGESRQPWPSRIARERQNLNAISKQPPGERSPTSGSESSFPNLHRLKRGAKALLLDGWKTGTGRRSLSDLPIMHRWNASLLFGPHHGNHNSSRSIWLSLDGIEPEP